MPRKKKMQTISRPIEQKVTRVTMKPKVASLTFFDKIQADLENNKSYLNIILGALVLIILGVLAFNLFSKNNQAQIANNLGPASQTVTQPAKIAPAGDVSKDSLPGSYTVKDGDTLYLIAQKYYGNGYDYSKLAAANKMSNENYIAVGQVLQIPKADDPAIVNVAPAPAPQTVALNETPTSNSPPAQIDQSGAANETAWGPKISGSTYTVQAGDWLSKISGRAYGDVLMFAKIAAANKIPDPNKIEPGTVLQIPR